MNKYKCDDLTMYNKNWQGKKIILARAHQEKMHSILNNQNYISRINKKITLDDNKEYTEFISCSYLGLDQDIRLLNCVSNNINGIGMVFSSARTRMKYKGLANFEHILNEIFNAHTVVFSSTHMVHLGLIPLIASGEMPSVQLDINGCTFLLDITVHASIQINRGLMQQFGEVEIIDFNDLERLEKTVANIKSQSKTPLLFCDSVGSMGGILPLKELVTLTHKYMGYLYVDDAHGMSIYGKNGAGYIINCFGYVPERVIIATSLAKGFGVSGGVIVLRDARDIEFVKTYCSTYIFSGSLVNPLINACITSGNIHLSKEINELQFTLFSKIALFDRLIEEKSRVINLDGDMPIRGILIGNELAAIEAGIHLKNVGFLVSVATYPIRKKGSAIIRFGICANHTNMEIEHLCKQINLMIRNLI